ncbi:helix-turn-helix transcriptional regulator [Leptospira kmetyi]|uniref:Transcriptional regulator n=1 Tax=Leptospira kmetyi TaxID=408139 RepID=A0ABX4N9A5_9LEPT|nr:helix-turn-helix transcriptional regulator [Leptospira kmetyi]PJZ28724.1 transcriptional regulator [Leptospira kmetyi]PJZ39504.1 transcriptional regulator [Leptospira kmetyi]
MGNSLKKPGERLVHVLETLGLRQSDLATSIGTTQQTVSKWCSGKREIPLTDSLAIEAVHKIFHKWLLSGEGEMFVLPDSQKVQISILNKTTELIRKINTSKGLQSIIEDFPSLLNDDQNMILKMIKSLKNKS